MESGQWDEATALFRTAVLAFKDAKQTETAAYYLAAVLILDAQVTRALQTALTLLQYSLMHHVGHLCAFIYGEDAIILNRQPPCLHYNHAMLRSALRSALAFGTAGVACPSYL